MKRILAGVSRAAACVLGVVSVLFAASSLGLLPLGSALSGASYLPPSWLFLGVAPVCLLCWSSGARRWAVGLALAFVLCVLPWADDRLVLQAPAPGPTQDLSVIALNVQYYSHGLETVARTLNQTGADVFLLSENVLDPAGAARARALFAPRDFRMGRSGETAIVSRYPILSFTEVDLPSAQASLSDANDLAAAEAGKERRSFTHAVLDVHGTRVNVLALRFIAGRAPEGNLLGQAQWGAYLVRTQAAELEAFEKYAAKLQGPVMFGGDLNAPPSAGVVEALRKHWEDAYLARHHLGRTTFRVKPVSYLRLDYLFSSKDVRTLESRRLDLEISDHFPVFARFALPGKS